MNIKQYIFFFILIITGQIEMLAVKQSPGKKNNQNTAKTAKKTVVNRGPVRGTIGRVGAPTKGGGPRKTNIGKGRTMITSGKGIRIKSIGGKPVSPGAPKAPASGPIILSTTTSTATAANPVNQTTTQSPTPSVQAANPVNQTTTQSPTPSVQYEISLGVKDINEITENIQTMQKAEHEISTLIKNTEKKIKNALEQK